MKVPVATAPVFVEEDGTVFTEDEDSFIVLLAARVVIEVVEVVRLLLDAAQLPGIHCEYHSLLNVQHDPETHVVSPVQPVPPPGAMISLAS